MKSIAIKIDYRQRISSVHYVIRVDKVLVNIDYNGHHTIHGLTTKFRHP